LPINIFAGKEKAPLANVREPVGLKTTRDDVEGKVINQPHIYNSITPSLMCKNIHFLIAYLSAKAVVFGAKSALV
jgi:cytochrome bd-type quinol oxidase subunit 1